MRRLLESDRLKLAILVLLAGVFLINSRALWFSDEIRYADAYSNLVNYKKWIVLFLNGEPYPDKPPVYFWAVYIVQSITRMSIPSSMFLTSILSAVFYMMCHYSFAMKLTGDKKLSYISGLVLLSNFYFLGLINYVRMDMLFAGFIILAFLYTAKYLSEDRARYIYAAFAFGGIAVMVKGPLGIVFPLVFLVSAGLIMKKYRRILSFHVFFALLLAAVPSLMWLYSITLIEGRVFLEHLIRSQILDRAQSATHHEEPFYYYLYTLPLVWFPWLLSFVVSAKNTGRISVNFFTGSRGGMFAGVVIASGVAALSVLSGKVTIYTLPLFSPISVMFAYIYLNSDKAKFWLGVSVFSFIGGTAIFFINRLGIFKIPLDVMWSGIAALAGAFIIYGFRKHKQAAVISVVVIIVFFNITGLTLIKSGDNIFSPKKQAEIMRSYVDKGYEPLAYRVYSGMYSYYSGVELTEIHTKPILRLAIAPGRKVVFGIAQKHWKGIVDNPETRFEIVDTQWVMGRTYLLIVSIPPRNTAQ